METLRERIMRHEGFCEFPKPDAKEFWVVGYGHDITKDQVSRYEHGISAEEADQLLDEDIATATKSVAKGLPWTLDLPKICQEVLIEMAFQMGVSGLLGFKNLLFHARSGNLDGVAQSMLNSKWHGQTPARCEELAGLYLNPEAANT
jgi:lysozyme